MLRACVVAAPTVALLVLGSTGAIAQTRAAPGIVAVLQHDDVHCAHEDPTRPAHDPLTRGFVWHVGRPLDLDAMRSAAAVFVGEHDFSSFCRAVEGKSTIRVVSELSVEEGEVATK
jgi:tRNA pseudouridine38-40 synthase